jgi:probable F420-dependent oxidoreductase
VTERRIRFATQLGSIAASPGDDWVARVRRLEAVGYETLEMPDHVVGQAWSPHPALAAVAATTGLRIGALVLDNDFRNPLITAREAATLDVLSNGRYELGLGAGWHDRDYKSLGMPMDRGRVRVERLAEAVRLMKRLFTEEEVTHEGKYYRMEAAKCAPKTVQQPHPPFLIAGGGPQILELAALEADILAIVPFGAGARTPTVDDISFDGARAQLGRVRDVAGSRFARIELSMFVDCAVTDDREGTIRDMAEKSKTDPEITRRSIYRAIGTLDEIQTHVRRVRQELGITYFCLRGPDIERLGPVITELAGT